MHTENLIVGLGIAGINLCHQLEKSGRSFVVIDACPVSSSSIIAGGIYNPIVIKRKVKTWKADALFALLVPTYREMEELLGRQLLHHDFPILKPISSHTELDEWQQAVDSGAVAPYVTDVVRHRPEGPFTNSVCGHVIIRHGGFLRTDETIMAYRQRLRVAQLLFELSFDHSQLQLNEQGVKYGDITADRAIFCEGRHISENPWFNWLPMRPTKGQMLTVRTEAELAPDKVYNQQFYLFPSRTEGHFRLGATYEWNDLDEETTDAARDELLQRTAKALDVRLEVLDQQAAIRPNVADRRPLLGRHPRIPNLYLFNGMGSKGVMLAPWFARQLVQHIYAYGSLEPEADLKRFIKRCPS
jgi:glycine/D-amino acid oxidase-like deaminating enzyme